VRKLAFCVFLAVFAGSGAVFAQANKTSSDYYPVRVYIEKIYPYRAGYVVSYKQGLATNLAYLPNEWFSRVPEDPGEKGSSLQKSAYERYNKGLPPKAELILLRGGMAPYMSVYYKQGEDASNPSPQFDHVRVYAPKNYQDPHWGVVRHEINLDEDFENVETLDLAFKTKAK